MSGIGDMSKEEAEKHEAEGAATIAQQQADFAASQASSSSGEGTASSGADLYAVGFAPSTDMTSLGGPWNGLPAEAATDPNHPDWAENCRWACVQGSFFACTFDGSTNIGDHAENVRGYGIPTEESGQAFMRNISAYEQSERVRRCIEGGNDIVYNNVNINFTKV